MGKKIIRKIVYALTENGELIGEHECQPDPLDGGWLYPSYYTEITPPPTEKKNKKLIFNKITESWSEFNNFIGEQIWSKETGDTKICETADIPENYTIEQPATVFDEWNEKKAGWVTNIEKQTEAKWMQIRAERNALLAASDWTQLPDVKLAEKERAAYNKYRQTLRGIPQNYDDPDEIVWPDKI